MEAKITPEQAIELLICRCSASFKGHDVMLFGADEIKNVVDVIESLAADAAIGRAAAEILDNLPTCQGEFDSAPCLYIREISFNKGCHLEGVCRLRAGKGGE